MMEGMSPSLVTTLNIMIWTGCLAFIKMNMNLFSDWHTNVLKSLYWRFRREDQRIQHAVSKFLEEWIASRCCFLCWQCSTNCTLLHSRQSLKWKQNMREIINFKLRQFTHCTSLSLCLSVCVCGKIYKNFFLQTQSKCSSLFFYQLQLNYESFVVFS